MSGRSKRGTGAGRGSAFPTASAAAERLEGVEPAGVPPHVLDRPVQALGSGQSVRTIRGIPGVGGDDFLVVTGGKIDIAKRQAVDLMRQFSLDDFPHLKLLVFGPIVDGMAEEANQLVDGGKVMHVGWADSARSYDYFSAADLVVFPGHHSVYWEEAVGLGKPVVVKRWDGTEHVDCGGNCILFEGDDASAFFATVKRICADKDLYSGLLSSAEAAASGFRYSEIARKSIGMGDSF